MTFSELLAMVIAMLDRASVPFMVTGSLASSYHGEPRATRDIDIVIDPTTDSLGRLVDALLDAGFYVDRGVAITALEERAQFNAIAADAAKVDFIVRKDRPFSKEEFRRREPADLLGTPGFVTTAEDLILAKLEWAAASDSERQIRDVAGIVAMNDPLDERYIARWASALGTADMWRRIQEESR